MKLKDLKLLLKIGIYNLNKFLNKDFLFKMGKF